jgi:hypothetical protein
MGGICRPHVHQEIQGTGAGPCADELVEPRQVLGDFNQTNSHICLHVSTTAKNNGKGPRNPRKTRKIGKKNGRAIFEGLCLFLNSHFYQKKILSFLSCFSWISWTPVFEVLLTTWRKNQGGRGPAMLSYLLLSRKPGFLLTFMVSVYKRNNETILGIYAARGVAGTVVSGPGKKKPL